MKHPALSKTKRWLQDVGLLRRSYALRQLDLKLLPFLGRAPGFFIEAGANNGLDQSNTAYLERYCRWRGILIEPVPELAASCRVNRPKAIVEQCALVAADFAGDHVQMEYCNLMSLVRGARGDENDDAAHIAHGRQFLRSEQVPYSLSVPACTLSSVLDSHGIERIDLLSLDVEGYEPHVLRGLDFQRHAPIHILVETWDVVEVERALTDRYAFVAQLSHHDRLYRLR